MRTDIDYIISLMKEYTPKNNGELDEQEEAPSSGGDAGGGNSPTKWADIVGGPARGKANMLGKAGEKWVSGLTRGVANQLQ
jgi:hypothetical protein